jgi:hypothetical protein
VAGIPKQEGWNLSFGSLTTDEHLGWEKLLSKLGNYQLELGSDKSKFIAGP